MASRIATLLQVAGLAFLVVGAFMFSVLVGVLACGACLLLVGVILERPVNVQKPS